jgi:hypothetical protein
MIYCNNGNCINAGHIKVHGVTRSDKGLDWKKKPLLMGKQSARLQWQ